MSQKTEMIHIRLTVEEKNGLKKLAEKIGENPSRLARKWIREAINLEPDLLTDETSLLKIAIRQLIGIANNLNQITTAINAGVTHRTVDESYLQDLKKYVNSVKSEFQSFLLKTKKRWVKRL